MNNSIVNVVPAYRSRKRHALREYQFIELNHDANIATLVLNRPPLNVMTIAMMREMGTALDAIGTDQTLKALVVKAADGSRAFSAGVEIAEHTADKVEEMLNVFHHIFYQLVELDIPSIAVVDGAALGGGCELALACDMIVASERAKFGQPEIQVGVFPPIAAIMLPGIIGPKKAAELLLTGKRIDAHAALQIGLVNDVLPSDKLPEATEKLLATITALSGAALRLTKRAYRIGLAGDVASKLAQAEKLYLDEVMATHDAHEGLAAFMEKRAPLWTNS